MSTLKELIKEKSALQIEYKNQRKTVNLVGERTVHPSDASVLHGYNRSDLFHMYLAYAMLRGQDPAKCVMSWNEEFYNSSYGAYTKKKVDTIIEQHASEFEAVRADQ